MTARILYPRLSIEIDRAGVSATVSVSCDLDFTDFEVTNMNLLGLRYSVECELLNAQSPHPASVYRFDPQQFPRYRDSASKYEQATFETAAALRDLGVDLSQESSLVADVVLSNEDLGTVDSKRTQPVALHLAV